MTGPDLDHYSPPIVDIEPALLAAGAGSVAAGLMSGPVATKRGVAIAGNVSGGLHLHAPHPPTSQAAPWKSVRVFNLRGRRHRPHFTGRQDELAELDARLTGANPMPVVLYGLGGVGKTQLAVEYAHAHRGELRAVWLVRADTPAVLREQYAELAGPLGLPEQDEPDQDAQVADVTERLATHAGWLLIIDNADDPAIAATIDELLPDVGAGGRVLITSRLSNWSFDYRMQPVTQLDPDQATHLLAALTARPADAVAHDLVCELGGLPLAVEQAAAYCRQTGSSLDVYLSRFHAATGSLLEKGAPVGKVPVARTWTVSIDAVSDQNLSAAALLDFFAYLGPDLIPRTLFDDADTSGGESSSGSQSLADESGGDGPAASGGTADDVIAAGDEAAVVDPLEALYAIEDVAAFDEAVGLLHDYSLVEASPDSITVHRLLQAVVRSSHNPQTREAYATAVAHYIWTALPVLDPAVWPTYQELLPHALAAAEHAGSTHDGAPIAIALLGLISSYERECGAYEAAKSTAYEAVHIAEQHYGATDPALLDPLGVLSVALTEWPEQSRQYDERALAIAEATYGPEDSQMLLPVNNLGETLRHLGDPEGARPLLERALQIAESAYGPDHARTLLSLNNLGEALRQLGDAEGARPLLERAVRIAETSYAAEHPETLAPVNNLGLVLRQLGDVPAALPLLERALRIADITYGAEHPQTLMPVNNVGLVLLQLGDAAAARPLLERAVRIAESTYGAEHAESLGPLNNLGEALRQLGDVAGARPLLERAVRIAESTYGAEHAETLLPVNNLGLVLWQSGDIAGARPLFERAVRIAENTCGAEHPETLSPLNNLGESMRQLGDAAEARPLLERAVRIAENTFGPERPQGLQPVNNLGLVLWQLGDAAGTRPLLERAVRIAENTYGPEQPQTLGPLSNLGALLRELGDAAGARPLLERALRIAENSYGREHPQTLEALNNLGDVQLELGEAADAAGLFARAVTLNEVLYPGEPQLAVALFRLGSALQRAGRPAEAIDPFQRALAIDEVHYGPDHPEVLTDVNALAETYVEADRAGEALDAVALFARAVTLSEVLYPGEPQLAVALFRLGSALQRAGRPAEAIDPFQRAVAIDEVHYGPDHPEVLVDLTALAETYVEADRPGEAIALCERLLEDSERRFAADDYALVEPLRHLAAARAAAGRHTDALAVLERLIALRDRFGDETPEAGEDLTAMANTLEALGRHPDAEHTRHRAEKILTGQATAGGPR